MEGWYGRIFRGCGFFDPDKPIRKFTKKELHDLLYKEPTKIKVDGINLTYAGLIPHDPEVVAVQGRRRDAAAHPGVRGAGGDVHHLPRVRRHPARARRPDRRRSSGINIADACAMQISDLAEWVRELDEPSVAPLLAALQQTLDSFVEIGLGYLSLDRPAGTLSGGEAQRTKMIRHLGSSLTDVTYVFDEPTIGLHPHDIQRMNDLLLQLRDKGNTVLVVEHKPETIAIADHVVDLGPGAGTRGRRGLLRGHRRRAARQRHRHRPPPRRPGRPQGGGADAERRPGDPRRDDQQPAGRRRRHPARRAGGRHRRGRLREELADPRFGVRAGRRGGRSTRPPMRGSRRSNPATYTGLLDPIRKAFAKANGVKPALFSANSEGACPTCNGAGVIYTDLAMMASVATTCEECEGKRFQRVGAGVPARRQATSARCSRCP